MLAVFREYMENKETLGLKTKEQEGDQGVRDEGARRRLKI
jgi:hypothetical protein